MLKFNSTEPAVRIPMTHISDCVIRVASSVPVQWLYSKMTVHYSTMTLWQYSAMTVQCNDSTVQWQYSAMTVQCNDRTVQWQYSTMTVQYNDRTVQWQYRAITYNYSTLEYITVQQQYNTVWSDKKQNSILFAKGGGEIGGGRWEWGEGIGVMGAGRQ